MGCRRAPAPEANPGPVPTVIPVPSTAQPAAHASVTATPSPEMLEEAIDRIEEERSSAGGVATPPELRHYPDTRRFLALQIADAQGGRPRDPHDDAELIEMIRAGKFVRLAPMTDTYLLYEIGEDAKDDPLIHYEVERNKDVPLLPSVEAIARKKAELDVGGGEGTCPEGGPEERTTATRRDATPSSASTRSRELRRRERVLLADPAGSRADASRPPELHPPGSASILLEVADAYHRQRSTGSPPSRRWCAPSATSGGWGRELERDARGDRAPHDGRAFDVSYRYMARTSRTSSWTRREARGRAEGRGTAREARPHPHLRVRRGHAASGAGGRRRARVRGRRARGTRGRDRAYRHGRARGQKRPSASRPP
mgnify:CR=1 FL=1